jgi:hypothetical protein
MSGFSDLDYENGGSANKKTRVTTACESCRTRKRRCNGVRPVCGNCQELGYECVWTSGQKRRGPPKGYINNLEMRAQASTSILKLLERFLETVPTDYWPNVEGSAGTGVNPGIWDSYPLNEPEKVVDWYRTQLDTRKNNKEARSTSDINAALCNTSNTANPARPPPAEPPKRAREKYFF